MRGPTSFFEDEAYCRGYEAVAGLDEAGRGPLAGPVVAAAVILPRRVRIRGLDDSKLLAPSVRVRLFRDIARRAVGLSIGVASEREIDAITIAAATRLAMTRALRGLTDQPDFLLLDALTLPGARFPQRPVIKGDGLSISIAAASILAKVARDKLMHEYHRRYPCYNFSSHKGYATAEHLRLLALHGPCPAHRRTFQPVSLSESEDEWDE